MCLITRCPSHRNHNLTFVNPLFTLSSDVEHYFTSGRVARAVQTTFGQTIQLSFQPPHKNNIATSNDVSDDQANPTQHTTTITAHTVESHQRALLIAEIHIEQQNCYKGRILLRQGVRRLDITLIEARLTDKGGACIS